MCAVLLHVLLLLFVGCNIVSSGPHPLAIVSGVLTASAASKNKFVLIVGDRLVGAAVLQVDHQDHNICVFVEHGAGSLSEAHLECDDTKLIELEEFCLILNLCNFSESKLATWRVELGSDLEAKIGDFLGSGVLWLFNEYLFQAVFLDYIGTEAQLYFPNTTLADFRPCADHKLGLCFFLLFEKPKPKTSG